MANEHAFVPCAVCGKLVWRSRRDRIRWETSTCSRECSGKWRGIRNAKDEPTRMGDYYVIHMPEHPNASQDGYVKEHRLIVEQRLGRYLLPTEVVHHIDGNTFNNTDENLQLMTISEHQRLHHTGEDSPNAKFSTIEVEQMRAFVAGGRTQASVCREFGISAPHLSNIINGKYRSKG